MGSLGLASRMAPKEWTNPDCDVIDALTFANGNRREENLPTSLCDNSPVKVDRVWGPAAHISVSGAPAPERTAEFRLCQKHRKESPIREAKVAP